MRNFGQFVSANMSVASAEPLVGLDYITSEAKIELDKRFASSVLPLARFGMAATEFAVFGSLAEDHRFVQEREGVAGTFLQIPKIRTMGAVAEGQETDIDRYSSRILNKRALIARVIGLDELPQWDLVATGDMSLVGPRPLLSTCKDRYARLAQQHGVADESIEEWRELLNRARPGIYGESQALRHRRDFDEYTPLGSARTIEADLRYSKIANPKVDLKTVAFSTTTTLTQAVKSLR